MPEFETESPELATEHPEESPETVTKPIALDDMCNQLEIITNMMIKLKELMTAHKQNSWKKKILRKIGGHYYKSWFLEVKINFM